MFATMSNVDFRCLQSYIKNDDYAIPKKIEYAIAKPSPPMRHEEETALENEAVASKLKDLLGLNDGFENDSIGKNQCGNKTQESKTLCYPYIIPKQVIREDTNMLPNSDFQTLLSDGKLVPGKISNLEEKDSQTAIKDYIDYLTKDMPSGNGDDSIIANEDESSSACISPSDLFQWAKGVTLFGENAQIPTSNITEPDKPKNQPAFEQTAPQLKLQPDKTAFLGPNGKTILEDVSTDLQRVLGPSADSSFIDFTISSRALQSESDNDIFEMNCGSMFSKPIIEPLPSPLPSEVSSILTDDDLTGLSIKDFNCRVKGMSREMIEKLRKRRRLLKNRTYAQRCRDKRVKTGQDYSEENKILKKQIMLAAKERDEYKNNFIGLTRELLKVLSKKQEQKQQQLQMQYQQQLNVGDSAQNMTIMGNCGLGSPEWQFTSSME